MKAGQGEDDAKGLDCSRLQECKLKFIHDYSNCYSRVTFSWLWSILSLGNNRPLEGEDLGELPTTHMADTNHKRFFAIWEKERNKAAKQRRTPSLWRSYFLTYKSVLLKAAICRLCADLLTFMGPLSLKEFLNFVGTFLESGSSGKVKPAGEGDVFV